MHINDDHMYHGAALIQIAEHKAFTAINRFENTSARDAFRINASTGIYLKYRFEPTNREYGFTFNRKHLDELEALKTQCTKLFIVMVCVKGKEICCISMDELEEHILERQKDLGRVERQYQVLVLIPPDRSFRVYVNAARRKRLSLSQRKVARNRFPSILFSEAD